MTSLDTPRTSGRRVAAGPDGDPVPPRLPEPRGGARRRAGRRAPRRAPRRPLLERLALLTARRARWVLAAAAAVVVVALTWGTAVFGSLTAGGFTDPDSESTRAQALAEATLGPSTADLVVLYTSADRSVDDAEYQRAVETHLAGLPRDRVATVVTTWTTGAEALVSADRRSTYAALWLTGDDEDAKAEDYRALAPLLDRPAGGLDVALGGDVAVYDDVTTQIQHDIERAETISMPVTLVLLVAIFGGVVAAGLPLLIGVLAILGALTALRLLTLVTDVSVFSVNIVVMLGLGLSIDYALFVVSRFREELRAGDDVEAALVRTVVTAGRTVAFSGLTVAIALASLLLFPQVFLRSMGFGGMAAVVVAMVAALTVLPALLAILGHRVDALRPRAGRRAVPRHRSTGPGAWHRIAAAVMDRPLRVVAVVVPLLLLLGAPFLGVQFGTVDHRALPQDVPSRVVAERLAAEFPGGGSDPVEVLVSDPPTDPAVLDEYQRDLAGLPGVTGIRVETDGGATTRLLVAHAHDDQSEPARDLVAAVRAVPAPPGAEVLVGGPTAELVDLLASLGRTLPWMALAMVAVTLVLLFLAFGSLVLPVKAVLMNLLSLSASFGAVVWIFQDGHLADLLGVTVTGTIEATQPLLMLAVAFGLSMDYEVFLLSRVREEWDRRGDNREAVAAGLQHTGRIITSAALLLIVVIGAFSTSGITFIRMLGVGLVIAILVDATLVRLLLVPATMQLMGRANWWAPAPLARFWQRHGFREG